MTTEAIEVPAVQIDTQQQVERVISWAKELKVTTATEYQLAVETIKQFKSLKNGIVAFFAPSKRQADDLHKTICTNEARFVKPLTEAENIAKDEIKRYLEAEERKRVEEQRKLQAEQDAKAAAERAKLEKQAERLKTPEKREERLAAAAAVTAPVVELAKTAPTVAGTAIKKTYKARLTSLPELVAAAAGGNQVALSLLSYNESAANQFARSTKGSVNVPGVQFYPETGLSIGK